MNDNYSDDGMSFRGYSSIRGWYDHYQLWLAIVLVLRMRLAIGKYWFKAVELLGNVQLLQTVVKSWFEMAGAEKVNVRLGWTCNLRPAPLPSLSLCLSFALSECIDGHGRDLFWLDVSRLLPSPVW